MLREEDLSQTVPPKGQIRTRWSIPVAEIKFGRPFRAWITSLKIHWFDCHWWGGRHIPCTIKMGDCVHLRVPLRTDYIGWVSCLPEGANLQMMLKITMGMLETAPEVDPRGWVRGYLVEVDKKSEKLRSRSRLYIRSVLDERKTLPDPLDVMKWFLNLNNRAVAILAQKLTEPQP